MKKNIMIILIIMQVFTILLFFVGNAISEHTVEHKRNIDDYYSYDEDDYSYDDDDYSYDDDDDDYSYDDDDEIKEYQKDLSIFEGAKVVSYDSGDYVNSHLLEIELALYIMLSFATIFVFLINTSFVKINFNISEKIMKLIYSGIVCVTNILGLIFISSVTNVNGLSETETDYISMYTYMTRSEGFVIYLEGIIMVAIILGSLFCIWNKKLGGEKEQEQKA